MRANARVCCGSRRRARSPLHRLPTAPGSSGASTRVALVPVGVVAADSTTCWVKAALRERGEMPLRISHGGRGRPLNLSVASALVAIAFTVALAPRGYAPPRGRPLAVSEFTQAAVLSREDEARAVAIAVHDPVLRPLLEGRRYQVGGLGLMDRAPGARHVVVGMTLRWEEPFSAAGNWPWLFPTQQGFRVMHVRVQRLRELLVAVDLDSGRVLHVTLGRGHLLEQTTAPASWVPWLTKRPWTVTVASAAAAVAVILGGWRWGRELARASPPQGRLSVRVALSVIPCIAAIVLVVYGLGHIYNWEGFFRQNEDYPFTHWAVEGIELYFVPAVLFAVAGVYLVRGPNESNSRLALWLVIAGLAAYGVAQTTMDTVTRAVVDRTFLLLCTYGYLLAVALAQAARCLSGRAIGSGPDPLRPVAVGHAPSRGKGLRNERPE